MHSHVCICMHRHLGGDEVVYGCWKNDSSITNYMNANKITSYDDLLGIFVKKADAMLTSLGKHT